ncbi:hypothetical protein AAVH_41571, partial [Aphelenchoides avenae]
ELPLPPPESGTMNESDRCSEAHYYAHDAWLRIVNLLLVLLSMIVLVMVIILFHKLRHKALPFHANLKVIFINVLVLYVSVSIVVVAAFTRLQLNYFIYSHSCESLTIPTWMSIAVRGPLYLYVASFPLWHLVLTIERLVATTKADRYEASRPVYGVAASCAVWATLIAYTVYIVRLAMEDEGFGNGTHYYLLTTETNAWVVITAQWLFLAIDLTTFFADVSLIFVNRRKRLKATSSYNLSRNYQITENVRVTMHLILPLDICNTVLFLISLSISTVCRYSFDSSSLSHRSFSAITDATNA